MKARESQERALQAGKWPGEGVALEACWHSPCRLCKGTGGECSRLWLCGLLYTLLLLVLFLLQLHNVYLFIYLLIFGCVGSSSPPRLFSSRSEWGYFLVVVCGLLSAVTSLVTSHGLGLMGSGVAAPGL